MKQMYIDFGYGLEMTEVEDWSFRMMTYKDHFDWMFRQYIQNHRTSDGSIGLLEARWSDRYNGKLHSKEFFAAHTEEEIKEICEEDFKKCVSWIESKIQENPENPDGIWDKIH